MLKNKNKLTILKFCFYFVICVIVFNIYISFASAATSTLLSDDFTGTTIDTAKWVEYDAAGSGGSSGNIQQNNSLTVQNSDNGTTALVSLDNFSADSLELSATISYGGLFLFGYGDREWSLSGNKAYLIYQSGANILGLAWNDHVLNQNVTCTSSTSGANYKMKIIPTGFEIYKNDVLACTVTPTSQNLVDNKPIFLESNNAGVTTYDNVLVTGIPDEEVTVPDAPTIGTATAGDTQVTVTFTPGSSGGSPITGYTVTSNPGNITATGSSSPIIVTGLTNEVEYTFTVTATNAIGTSASSNPSNAVTPGATTILDSADLWFKADVITGLNDGEAVSTWPDSSVNNLDLAQSTANKKPIYKTNIINSKPIVRFDGVDDLLITPSTSNSAGITVFSVVKSADTSGGYFVGLGGNNNAIIHGYTGGSWEYYNSPRTVIGSISTSEFQIITSRVGSSLTGSISLGADAGTVAPWAGDVAELIIYKSVLSNDDYNTVVDYLNAKYFVLSEPGVPTDLTAIPSNEQMLLSWTAPVSNGGASITDYLVEYKLSSTSTWSTFSDGVSTSTSVVVTNLTNDLSYNFRVSAINSVGTGGASDIATGTPALSVPTAPINLSATSGSNQITLSWTAPVSDGGASITDYLVEYKLSSTST